MYCVTVNRITYLNEFFVANDASEFEHEGLEHGMSWVNKNKNKSGKFTYHELGTYEARSKFPSDEPKGRKYLENLFVGDVNY